MDVTAAQPTPNGAVAPVVGVPVAPGQPEKTPTTVSEKAADEQKKLDAARAAELKKHQSFAKSVEQVEQAMRVVNITNRAMLDLIVGIRSRGGDLVKQDRF